MERNLPFREMRKRLAPRRNLDVVRNYYCYQVGSAFLTLGWMESRIVSAMATCDRIKLANVLKDDLPFWDQIAERFSRLQSSTLGNLIAILAKHGISESDLNYLRWVKAKRDFFVHRFCSIEPWPEDMSDGAARVFSRRLAYLELIFGRAGKRIYHLFGRAGLVEIVDLGEDGFMIGNVGSPIAGALRDLAIAEVRRHARQRAREAKRRKR
jgi:hypothetical protein